MKIYAISGLGADERVFKKLKLDYPIHIIQWYAPNKEKDLSTYAKSLLEQIDLNDQVILIGVSFGGMIAIALQPYVHPMLTILISSAQNKYELPVLYRWVGKMQILRWIPSKWMKIPKSFAKWLFKAEDEQTLYAIIRDTDLQFLKWALLAITSWDEDNTYANVVKIHGTKDRVIPYRASKRLITVKDGGHFMIVDKAAELSQIINKQIRMIASSGSLQTGSSAERP